MTNTTITIGPETSEKLSIVAEMQGVSIADLASLILNDVTSRQLPPETVNRIHAEGAERFRQHFGIAA